VITANYGSKRIRNTVAITRNTEQITNVRYELSWKSTKDLGHRNPQLLRPIE
jgi:hypothetical protein